MTVPNRPQQQDSLDSFDFNAQNYGRRQRIPPWLLIGVPLLALILIICSVGVALISRNINQQLTEQWQIEATRTRIARTEEAATALVVRATQDALDDLIMDQTRTAKQALTTTPAPTQNAFVENIESAVNDYTEIDFDQSTAGLYAATANDYQWAQGFIALRKYDLAIANYNRIIAANPNYIYHLERGKLLLKTGQIEQAIIDFSQAEQIAPQIAQNDILFHQVLASVGIVNLSLPEGQFGTLPSFPATAEGYYVTGLVRMKENNMAGALQSLQLARDLAIETDETFFLPEIYFALAKLFVEREDYEVDHLNFERSLADGGLYAPQLQNQFELLYQTNRDNLNPSARVTLTSTPEIWSIATPVPMSANLSLANQLYSQERFAESLLIYDQLEADNQINVTSDFLYRRGRTYIKLGLYEEAQIDLRRSLEFNGNGPDAQQVAIHLAYAHLFAEDYTDTYQYITFAQSYSFENREIDLAHAFYLLHQNEPHDAAQLLESLAPQHPFFIPDSSIQSLRALASLQIGEFTKAQEHAQRAVRLQPDHLPAYEIYIITLLTTTGNSTEIQLVLAELGRLAYEQNIELDLAIYSEAVKAFSSSDQEQKQTFIDAWAKEQLRKIKP